MYKIDDYRNQVLSVLKESNNHYDTEVISLSRLDKNFSYHRWLHPYQGSWEVEHLFSNEILTNLSKIIQPGSVVIDIGAQTGNMSVAYSLFVLRVLAF